MYYCVLLLTSLLHLKIIMSPKTVVNSTFRINHIYDHRNTININH